MKYLLLTLIISITTFAQQEKFIGEAKPGTIIFAKADSIKKILFNDKPILFNKDGNFIFGFDKEDEGEFELKIIKKNKKEVTYKYNLTKIEYDKQELSLSKKMVNPPKKFLSKIKKESAQLKNARKKLLHNTKDFYLSGFSFPVKNVRITSQFGLNRILNGQQKNFHNGIDFGGSEGDSIFAIADGIVQFVGKNFYYNGNFILVDHGQGLNSIYLHLSKILVKNNQTVKKGELIGLMGSTGRATGPHLHLGVQWFNKRIDPMTVLNLNFE